MNLTNGHHFVPRRFAHRDEQQLEMFATEDEILVTKQRQRQRQNNVAAVINPVPTKLEVSATDNLRLSDHVAVQVKDLSSTASQGLELLLEHAKKTSTDADRPSSKPPSPQFFGADKLQTVFGFLISGQSCDSFLGDLEEGYFRRCQETGSRHCAEMWRLKQVFRSLFAFAWSALMRSFTQHSRRKAR